MLLMMIRVLFLALICTAALPNEKEQPERPRLVVGIVVDQMRQDYLESYWKYFGENGFKRLKREGYVITNNHYNYFPTYTGPGHAAIYSGALPSVSGAVGNSWYDRDLKRTVYVVEDRTVETVGSASDAGKLSPKKMLSSTLTDELKSVIPKGKVLSVGLKDRSAINSAGHAGDAAYWYENDTGNFISSTWYMDELPEWVIAFNREGLAREMSRKTWETFFPVDEYSGSNPDDSPYERPFATGEKPVFPYDLSKYAGDSYSIIKTSPFGNTLITEFAKRAIEEESLGEDEHTDILALNYGAPDYVGHRFGPHSIEVADIFTRFDRELEELFGYLDKVVGKGNYLVFLTSDHGAADVPAERIDRGLPGGYFDSGAALDSLKHYLNSRYGKGNWVEAYINQQIYLDRDLIDKKGLALKKIQDETAGFIRRFEGVKSANTGYNYRHKEYSDGPEKMYQNGFMAARSGDVFIQLNPGWLDRTSRTGTTHGSPYDYDTHVPLLFMGWGIPHGRNDCKTVITQIAPTLSRLLNIPIPDGTQAKVLNFD